MLWRHRVPDTLTANEALIINFAGQSVAELIGHRRCQSGEILAPEQVHRPLSSGGVFAHIRYMVEPMTTLSVHVGQASKYSSVKEVVLQVINHPLDLALGARPPHAMRLNGQPIVICEVNEQRVPGITVKLNLLHIVVEDLVGPSTKERECVEMTPNQALYLHRRSEFDIEHARK